MTRAAYCEDDVDVGVPRRPGVAQDPRSEALEDADALIAEPVEGLAKGLAPFLVPTGTGAGVAATVALPPAYAVAAAPGRSLDDLDLADRVVCSEERPIVRDPRQLALIDVVERVGECHVAVAMMVTVGLTVGGDVDELGPLAAVREGVEQPVCEVLAASQQLLECHGTRDRSVIEEDGNRFSGWQAAEVGRGGIDRANLLGPLLLADVACIGEGKDHVVVGLRDGGAVALEAVAREPVGVEDGGIDLRLTLLEPGEERRPEVEGDRSVVVDDLGDEVAGVEDARGGIRPVALGGDPLVPVVIRMRRILRLHGLQPGVLARRLVEVTVNADVANAHRVGDGSAGEEGASARFDERAVPKKPIAPRWHLNGSPRFLTTSG